MSNFSVEERGSLRNCELLRELPDKHFNTFMSISQRVSYAKGETLLHEGHTSNHLFIVISGAVNLYKSAGVKQHHLDSLSGGQSIGEMRVIRDHRCSLTVITSEPTVVLCVLISKLRDLEYNQCYECILDAIINIVSYRLIKTNQLAVRGLREKKNGFSRFFPLMTIAVVTLFLCELGVALYYLM